MKSGLKNGADSPVVTGQASTGGYSHAFAAPEPAALAQHFPQLAVLELLGQGGMGAVYKARQLKLDRLVALKILPLETGSDPTFAERFTREARALARLNHANIVSVHDFGEAGGLYYFIMEYVDGANLRQLLWARQLQPQDSLKIIPQVCEALQYAHDEGVVHRDIKPENILVDKRGKVKIADFGLAKLLGAAPAVYTLTGSRQMMGTPHYMAPEQMEKPLEVDHRADIFSLGVVFYELLTSELPLGRFAPPSKKVQVDARFDEVVFRALAKEPELRYQHVSDIKLDIEAIGRATPPSPSPAAVGLAKARKEYPELDLMRVHVQGPAAALLVTSILAALSWIAILSLVPAAPHYSPSIGSEYPGFYTLSIGSDYPGLYMLVLLPSVLLFVLAIPMGLLRSYGAAVAGSILAMAPWHPTWPLGLAVGIWSLRTLRERAVQEAFGHAASLRGQPLKSIDAVGLAAPQSPAATVGARVGQEDSELDLVRVQVQGAAAGLLVTSVLAFVSWSAIFIGDFFWKPGIFSTPLERWLFWLLALSPCPLLSQFATNMGRLRSYNAAVAGSILAMLPWHLTWPLGLAMGISCLRTLRKPAVMAAFARTAQSSGHQPAESLKLDRQRRRQRETAVVRGGGWLGAIVGAIIGGIVGLSCGRWVFLFYFGLIGAVVGLLLGRFVAGFCVGYVTANTEYAPPTSEAKAGFAPVAASAESQQAQSTPSLGPSSEPPPAHWLLLARLRSVMRSVRYYCVDSLVGGRPSPTDENRE
jgi:predicted Ser/Thr protein kinase